MSLHSRESLADLTESEVRVLTREDVEGLSGHLASTITAKQIPWFSAEVLGQFLLGERKSGMYNFSGGNYLRHEVFAAISPEQVDSMVHSKNLPSVKDLARYLLVKKMIAHQTLSQ
jgi:hypothetical protein